jgi:hypothetical protein
MGRPRKPTAILELTGAFKRNPQRKRARAGEPIATGETGCPPVHFDEPLSAIWYEIIGVVPAGVLTAADRILLELTCTLIQGLRTQTSERGDKALLKSCLASLGMSPAERSRISVPRQPEVLDELAALAAECRGFAMRSN